MTNAQYREIEEYMLVCMTDSAHDKEHVYRVLFVALDIASCETNVDTDILIAACLLHDIGREEQLLSPEIDHALAGGEKAYNFLLFNGWDEARARHVRDCVETHRFRAGRQPQSLEAKIVFDADKLDVAGTLGIARTILYKGCKAEPLYTLRADGTVSDGIEDVEPSFFREYHFKLEKLYGSFYTHRAAELAASRQRSAIDYYKSLLTEARSSYEPGRGILAGLLEEKNE